MGTKQSGDQYSKAETECRYKTAPQGAFDTPVTPLKT
jgi:hypothetical protein